MQLKERLDPQELAKAVLERFAIKAEPVPVDRIAKLMGAQLRYSPLDDELSGMIYIKDQTPIIGVNSMHHPNRQRFTIAHEIGHLEMHRALLSDAVHVDKQFQVLMRDGTSSQGVNDIEVEANRFAAELLVPTFLLDKYLAGKMIDIHDDSLLANLAKKFRVSTQTLAFRINKLK